MSQQDKRKRPSAAQPGKPQIIRQTELTELLEADSDVDSWAGLIRARLIAGATVEQGRFDALVAHEESASEIFERAGLTIGERSIVERLREFRSKLKGESKNG